MEGTVLNVVENNDRISDGAEKGGIRSRVLPLLEFVAVGFIFPYVFEVIYGRFLISTFPCLALGDLLHYLLWVPIPLLWMYFGFRVWRRSRRKKAFPLPVLVGSLIGSFVVLVVAFGVEEWAATNAPPVRNVWQAAQALHIIAEAEKLYVQDLRKGFSPDLKALEPYIIPAVRRYSAHYTYTKPGSMPAGPGPGYTLQYAASAPDSQGQINGYKLIATPVLPGKTGCYILRIDESGELRQETVRLDHKPRAGPR